MTDNAPEGKVPPQNAAASEPRYEIVVIGGGIAGAACALRAAQYRMRTAWILGDKRTARASRSRWVANVDNMIGIHADIVLNQLGDALDNPPHLHISTRDIIDDVHRRIDAEYPEHVTRLELAATAIRREEDGSFVVDAGDQTLAGEAAVLCTGMMDRQPHIAREHKGEVRDVPDWVYPFANRESVLYCVRCEGHLTRDSCVVVIGHTEAAGSVALMLAERYGSACHLLTNGETPELSADTRRLLDHWNIAVRTERIVDLEEQGDGLPRHRLRSVVLADGTRIGAKFALVSLGIYRVYNDLARQLGAALEGSGPVEERYVSIDSRGETSVHNFFAVGDVARRPDEPVMKQIYTAQEYAVRAVDSIDSRRRRKARARILASG